MNKVNEKLFEVQNKLKSSKGQYNSYGKYYYRTCEDILEAVKPLLFKHKVIIILNDTLEMIGARYYIKVTAHFIDVETGEEISNTAYAREEETKKGMDSSQITGASSSYARKYALNGLLCIDDNKDSDSSNTGSKEPVNDILCQDCGIAIAGKGRLTAEEIADGTKKHYGRILCATCGHKQKEEKDKHRQEEAAHE